MGTLWSADNKGKGSPMENGTTIAARALIQSGVCGECDAGLATRASEVFLIAFAGILFAILFFGDAEWFRSALPIPSQ